MPRKGKDWGLTPERLKILLDAIGDGYNRLHARLVTFFEHNMSSDPYQLADMTLDRLACKLQDEAVPAPESEYYALGIARLVLKEDFRERGHPRDGPENGARIDEECIEHSFQSLDQTERLLIQQYYPEKKPAGGLPEHRRALARELGISYDVLRMKASKLVTKMRKSYADCTAKKIW